MEAGGPRTVATQLRVVALLFHDVYERDPSESGFAGAAADRYKLSTAAFDAQLAGLAGADLRSSLVAAPGWEAAPTALPCVITVDDGGVSYYTLVADRLEARGWRGYCFVTTAWMGQPGFLSGDQLRELHRRGHLIGSHTVSHPPNLRRRVWSRLVSEWADSRKALEDVLGAPVAVGSVPGGAYAPRVALAAAEAGLRLLFTSDPVVRARSVGACTVVGRFAVRGGAPPDFARNVAMLKRWTRLREWGLWNLKQLAKPMVAGFPRGRSTGLCTLECPPPGGPARSGRTP